MYFLGLLMTPCMYNLGDCSNIGSELVTSQCPKRSQIYMNDLQEYQVDVSHEYIMIQRLTWQFQILIYNLYYVFIAFLFLYFNVCHDNLDGK